MQTPPRTRGSRGYLTTPRPVRRTERHKGRCRLGKEVHRISNAGGDLRLGKSRWRVFACVACIVRQEPRGIRVGQRVADVSGIAPSRATAHTSRNILIHDHLRKCFSSEGLQKTHVVSWEIFNDRVRCHIARRIYDPDLLSEPTTDFLNLSDASHRKPTFRPNFRATPTAGHPQFYDTLANSLRVGNPVMVL